MDRQYYLELARSGLSFPIGADLVLKEYADHDDILRDGKRLGQIIADILAERRIVVPVVEGIVNQLESRPEVQAIGGHRGFDLRPGVADDGAQARGGLEQLGGFVADDLEVAFLRGFRVVAVEQLLHLALGDGIGGMRQDVHHAHVADLYHHLEGA